MQLSNWVWRFHVVHFVVSSLGSPRLEQDARNPTLINYDQYLNEQLDLFFNFLRLHCRPIYFFHFLGIFFLLLLIGGLLSKILCQVGKPIQSEAPFSGLLKWIHLTGDHNDYHSLYCLGNYTCQVWIALTPITHLILRTFFFGAPSQILSRFNMIIKISFRLVEEIISPWRSLLIDEKEKLHLEAPRHLHFQSTLFQLIN